MAPNRQHPGVPPGALDEERREGQDDRSRAEEWSFDAVPSPRSVSSEWRGLLYITVDTIASVSYAAFARIAAEHPRLAS